jgi:hypothetical protein
MFSFCLHSFLYPKVYRVKLFKFPFPSKYLSWQTQRFLNIDKEDSYKHPKIVSVKSTINLNSKTSATLINHTNSSKNREATVEEKKSFEIVNEVAVFKFKPCKYLKTS